MSIKSIHYSIFIIRADAAITFIELPAVCYKNNKETRVLLGELADSLFRDNTNLFIDNASKNSGKTANSILSAENTKCNAKSNPTEEKFDTIFSAAIELKYFDAKYCECNLKASQILKVIRPNSGLVKNFSPLFTNQ